MFIFILWHFDMYPAYNLMQIISLLLCDIIMRQQILLKDFNNNRYIVKS